MRYLKIVISYSCDKDKKSVKFISKKINRVLEKYRNIFFIETSIVKCHRRNNNIILIQPTHEKMDLSLSECYQELLKMYVKANECKSLFASFMSRVKIGSIQIKI